MKKEKIILTGDRPTGKLHIGHYVRFIAPTCGIAEFGFI